MGSTSTPDIAYAAPVVSNPSKTRALDPRMIDSAQDRMGTGCYRGAVPIALSRGIADDYHETDDAGYWTVLVTVPAYTRAVGLRVLGVVERDSSNDDANVAIKYSLVKDSFAKQLVLTQEDHGIVPADFAAAVAWSRQWKTTRDNADPSSSDWIEAPLAVPASNEPQPIQIYLEAHSDLDFYVVAVQPYVIPYTDQPWPSI